MMLIDWLKEHCGSYMNRTKSKVSQQLSLREQTVRKQPQLLNDKKRNAELD